jgi:hypothetical protein
MVDGCWFARLQVQDLPGRNAGKTSADDRLLSLGLQSVPRPEEAGAGAQRATEMSQFDQIKELMALKAEFDFIREVPHHPLVQTVMDLHKSFAGFFEGRAGFPTFRKKGQNESFR